MLDEIMVVVLHDLMSGFIRSVRNRKINLSPPCENIASSWQSASQKERFTAATEFVDTLNMDFLTSEV